MRSRFSDGGRRPHVLVIGGGWAGCSAAVGAAMAGARVTLLERTDILLGTGLVGGIMKNNGRLTATEELREMGAGRLLEAVESCFIHENIAFPGHEHVSLYDVTRIDSAVLSVLRSVCVDVRFRSTCSGLRREDARVVSAQLTSGEAISADAFVDATGTAGPQANCRAHRCGCVMCILRCPTFGPRISPARSLGIDETPPTLTAATSGSIEVFRSSLSADLVSQLENTGHAEIPLPKHVRIAVQPHEKACRQYAGDDFYTNLVLLHTGEVKVMVPFMPLDVLRSINGLSRVRYVDPYSAGVGNSVRYNIVTPHDKSLRVTGTRNLFCAGEKVGLVVGHTEAIFTGLLAGHNAVRFALGIEPLEVPVALMCGDLLDFVATKLQSGSALTDKYTFSGSVYFQHATTRNLYTTDIEVIRTRVRDSGLSGVFASQLVDG